MHYGPSTARRMPVDPQAPVLDRSKEAVKASRGQSRMAAYAEKLTRGSRGQVVEYCTLPNGIEAPPASIFVRVLVKRVLQDKSGCNLSFLLHHAKCVFMCTLVCVCVCGQASATVKGDDYFGTLDSEVWADSSNAIGERSLPLDARKELARGYSAACSFLDYQVNVARKQRNLCNALSQCCFRNTHILLKSSLE